MKKDTKALVLGLIGAAVGVAALVIWIVVIAIKTGFYSTKVQLCTTANYTNYAEGESSKANQEGYQSWENFLTFKVTSEYDAFYKVVDYGYQYTQTGITSENYTDFKNLTTARITKEDRASGKTVYNANETYYIFSSQNYEKITDISADNWATYSGNIFTVAENNVTTTPQTIVSVEPSSSNTFAPSSYDGLSFEITFTYGLSGATEKISIGVNNKGYGSTTTSAFKIEAASSFTHTYFNVDTVSGTVVKK